MPIGRGPLGGSATLWPVARRLLIGATAADPANAVVIWNAIRRWFVEHGLPVEYALYSTYDAMGRALLSGQLDIAWLERSLETSS